MPDFINALPIGQYSPEGFAQHLRSIQSHDRRIKAERKARAKARVLANKPPAKAWSLSINAKDNPVLTIRKRKPAYLYISELNDIMGGHSEYEDKIKAVLERRGIELRPDSKGKDQ